MRDNGWESAQISTTVDLDLVRNQINTRNKFRKWDPSDLCPDLNCLEIVRWEQWHDWWLRNCSKTTLELRWNSRESIGDEMATITGYSSLQKNVQKKAMDNILSVSRWTKRQITWRRKKKFGQKLGIYLAVCPLIIKRHNALLIENVLNCLMNVVSVIKRWWSKRTSKLMTPLWLTSNARNT